MRKGIVKLPNILLVLAIVLVVYSLSGCGNKSAEPTYNENDPITITISWQAGEDITKNITEHPYMKARFPNIKFEYQSYYQLDEMIAANNGPDILNVHDSLIPTLIKKNVPYDVTDLIKKNNFDMKVFQPEVVTAIKAFSTSGKILGMPDKSPASPSLANTPYFTIYNKDIFEKFAVPFPKDNMTWDEILDLAKVITREEDGVKYTGFNTNGIIPGYIMPQLGLHFSSADKKVDFSAPGWQEMVRISKRHYDESGFANFMQNTTAMSVGYNEVYIFYPEDYEDIVNWDMATYPRVHDKLEVPLALGLYVVSTQSKHKDAAFKVISAFLSDEMLVDRRVKWDHPLIQKRNVNAIKGTSSALYTPNEFTNIGNDVFNQKFMEYIEAGTDTNTMLRELQQLVQQAVDEAP